jgi:hypothetical protein
MEMAEVARELGAAVGGLELVELVLKGLSETPAISREWDIARTRFVPPWPRLLQWAKMNRSDGQSVVRLAA